MDASRNHQIDQSDVSGGVENDDKFGRVLAAGDFNDDGYADLAVGVPGESQSGDESGRDAIIYGSSNGLTSTGHQSFNQDSPGISDQTEDGDQFGRSLAVGNFNGDDFADLAIGVPDENGNGRDSGLFHVLFGSGSGLTGTGSQTFSQDDLGDSREKDDHFGWALAAGDYDSDGVDDLVVSAPWEDSKDRGRIHLLYGVRYDQPNPGLSNSGTSFLGANGDRLGFALTAGHFSDGQKADFAASRPGWNTTYISKTRYDAGQVTVYYSANANGTTSWSQKSSTVYGAPETDDRFGSSLVAGNFNGDTRDDLAIGTKYESVNNDKEYFNSWLGSGGGAAAREDYDADLVGLIVENLGDGALPARGLVVDRLITGRVFEHSLRASTPFRAQV
ncbi:MAG: FG-GAP repeat protein, partial [Acidobacteriota bacterium]